jgi:hypothetical protein
MKLKTKYLLGLLRKKHKIEKKKKKMRKKLVLCRQNPNSMVMEIVLG